MAVTIYEFLSKLDGIKTTGRNAWMAKCPCHNDAKASLSITLGNEGTILLKCHAGCDTSDIVQALGLKMADLFPESVSKPHERNTKAYSPIVATYLYTDENGNLLYEKLRRADKTFSQRRPDGKGGWIYNRQGIPCVLYRLHEVAQSDYVMICEGEKDADTLARLGFSAATGESGAGPGKWLPEYTKQLAGKICFVLGDNDDVGRAYQMETANALHGIAKIVKVLDLSTVWATIPEHGDVSDYLEAVGQDDALDALATLMHDTPEWTPNNPLVEKKAADKHAEPSTILNVRPRDFSDAGNASVFVESYRSELKYTRALGWLWWDGTKWKRDEFKPTELALALSQAILDDAISQYKQVLVEQADASITDDEVHQVEARKAVQVGKAYLTHAKASRNAIRIKAMVELAKSFLVVEASTFDANPFELNTPSGIVDLTTGSIMPHEMKSYCSQITASAPSNEGAMMWNDFLNTVTSGSEDIKKFLQIVAGMALIGKVFHEGIILAHGGGRNGKSTLFNALGSALGTYLATLRGKRLVVTGELEEHQRLSVATLKQLGSTDMLTIEEKFKSPEDIKQSHTLVLFTNHLPRVGSTDAGTWRRLTVVPFNATIPQGTGVQNYADVLFEQAGGAIVSWAVQGAVAFVANGYKLNIPDEVKAATDAYRSREDWLTNFMNERCICDVNARVGANELYKVYRSWAEETGDYVRRLNEFTEAMVAAGYKNIKPKNKSTWLGVKSNYTEVYGGINASSY